jgi:glutathione S-transferase
VPFTLINARPSPFGRKVAIAMIEKGIAYNVRYDVPWGKQTCTPEFSPLQQLPILVTEQGENIYDSTYILEWLEARYPSPSLLPADVDRRLAAKKRQLLGERLMEVAQSLIFELHRPDPSSAWVERQTKKIFGALTELERLQSEHRVSANGSIDLGDIAIGTTLLLFEFVVVAGLSPPIDALLWRGRYARLTQFIVQLEKRPSFATTVPQPMDVDLQATVR